MTKLEQILYSIQAILVFAVFATIITAIFITKPDELVSTALSRTLAIELLLVMLNAVLIVISGYMEL